MNRKYMILVIFAVIFPVNSTFSSEARNIRKDLQSKYENNLLNECQLSEDGLSFIEVLDRDIRVMEDHKQFLQRNIDGCKGGFARSVVPFLNKIGAFTLGSVSAATGFFAVGGSDWANRVWQGEGDWRIKGADFGVKLGSFFGLLSEADAVQYNVNKLEYIDQSKPGFKEVAVLAPVAGAVSIVSGLLFVTTVYSIYRYHGRLDAAIAKWQTRIKRDNAIIARLKELKYDVSHR